MSELEKDDLRSNRGRGEGMEATILLDLMYWIPLNIQKAGQVGGSSIGHVNKAGLCFDRWIFGWGQGTGLVGR